jgi:hypothetical protein
MVILLVLWKEEMTAANQQIVVCFEEQGMTPEEIAADQDLEIGAVKAILIQCSSKYRKEIKNDNGEHFTDEDLIAANQVIANLMRYAEDERLQARCAMYVRDDKKGRLDAVKQMAGLNVNVMVWNEQMKKALAAVQRSKEVTVDIEQKERLLKDANAE